MSRVGQSIIEIPKGVDVIQDGNTISAKGVKGELSISVDKAVVVDISNGKITVTPIDKS